MTDSTLSRWARLALDVMTEWGDVDRASKQYLVCSPYFDVVIAHLHIAAALAALPRLPPEERDPRTLRRWAGGSDGE